MVKLSDILVSGKAGNEDLNITTVDAQTVESYFTTLFTNTPCKVLGLIINTTSNSATPAQLIPFEDVSPSPSPEMKFFYQLQIESPLLEIPYYWSVSQFLAMVESQKLEAATRFFLNEAIPSFKDMNYLAVPIVYSSIEDCLGECYVQR